MGLVICLPTNKMPEYNSGQYGIIPVHLSQLLSILSYFFITPGQSKMNKAHTNTLIYRLLNGDAPLSDEQHDAFLSKDRQLYAALLRLPNLFAETAMAIIR